MKLCFACEAEFDQVNWTCPVCAWTPPLIQGFHAFSPGSASQNDGLAEGAHHTLNKLQKESFWFRERNRLIQDVIRHYFPNASDVLELGCGSGYVLSGIREVLPAARLTATEIYSYGLRYAAQKVSAPSQFLQLDARALPFKKEFDLVGAFDVLEHIEEDERVVENIRNALKPGGGLLITVPQHPWLWSKADEFACHKRRYTQKQLASLLRRQNFEIILDTSFVFFLLPIMLVQRIITNRKTSYNISRELALPKILDKFFELLLKVERKLIKQGLHFPVGGSRLVLARLKEK